MYVESINEKDPKSGVWEHWRTLLAKIQGVGLKTIDKVISWLRIRKVGRDHTFPDSVRAASPIRHLLYDLESIASNTSDSTPDARLQALVKLVVNLPKVNKSKMDKELASLFYLSSLFNSFNDVIERYRDTSYPTCYPAGRQQPPFPDEYLTLSTIHRIKGSGFDTVFYLGTDDFLYRQYRSFKGKNRFHEVLLMNVACSRAERKLVLLLNVDRDTWESTIEEKDYPNPWTIIKNVESKAYKINYI